MKKIKKQKSKGLNANHLKTIKCKCVKSGTALGILVGGLIVVILYLILKMYD